MNYCTNCGEASKKNICEKCGAKQNTSHKFCGWCGEPLGENAHSCIKCKQKIKDGSFFKFIKKLCIIPIIIALYIVFGAFLGDNDFSNSKVILAFVVSGIAIVGSVLLFVPLTDNILNSKFKAPLRQMLKVLKVVLIFVLCATTLKMFVKPTEKLTIDHRACNEAVEVFHDEVKLKNEASFVANSFNIQEYDVMGNENLTTYKITIDYSAENGFGGMVRDTYEVTLTYDSEKDEFIR